MFVLEVGGILGRMANESGDFSISMLGDVPPATYLLLAASSIALLWRRSRPLIVLAATLVASLVWDLIGLASGPSLSIFVSLYSVGRYIEENRISLLALAGAVTLVFADDMIESEPVSVMGLSLALVFVPWYVGRRIEGGESIWHFSRSEPSTWNGSGSRKRSEPWMRSEAGSPANCTTWSHIA